MPASVPLSRRIEDEVAESTAGDYAPIIETTDEAHRMRAQAAKGVSLSTDAQPGLKPAKDDGSLAISRSEGIYRVQQNPALARRDLEP